MANVKIEAETILSHGRIVIENGDPKGKQGDGRFLKRKTCVNV